MNSINPIKNWSGQNIYDTSPSRCEIFLNTRISCWYFLYLKKCFVEKSKFTLTTLAICNKRLQDDSLPKLLCMLFSRYLRSGVTCIRRSKQIKSVNKLRHPKSIYIASHNLKLEFSSNLFLIVTVFHYFFQND